MTRQIISFVLDKETGRSVVFTRGSNEYRELVIGWAVVREVYASGHTSDSIEPLVWGEGGNPEPAGDDESSTWRVEVIDE